MPQGYITKLTTPCPMQMHGLGSSLWFSNWEVVKKCWKYAERKLSMEIWRQIDVYSANSLMICTSSPLILPSLSCDLGADAWIHMSDPGLWGQDVRTAGARGIMWHRASLDSVNCHAWVNSTGSKTLADNAMWSVHMSPWILRENGWDRLFRLVVWNFSLCLALMRNKPVILLPGSC